MISITLEFRIARLISSMSACEADHGLAIESTYTGFGFLVALTGLNGFPTAAGGEEPEFLAFEVA